MPTVVISSPSSAALQAGAAGSCSSPTRFPPSSSPVLSHTQHYYTNSSPIQRQYAPASRVSPAFSCDPSSAFATPAVPAAPPGVPPADSASPPFALRRSASRSRLPQGVEELRAALKRYSVDASSQDPSSGPSGDHSRGCMSAAPETLGGGSRPTSNNSNNHNQHDASMQPPPPSSEQVTQPAAAAAAAPLPITSSSSASVASVSPADVKGKRQLPDDPSKQASIQDKAVSEQRVEVEESEQTRLKRLRPPVPTVKLLPRRYEFAHPNDLVILVSSMIMELIQYNDTIPLQGGRLTRFHSRTPPRISVRDYLQRLTTHATLSPPILLSMVYYIDRLCALYPAFTVSSLTVHRFLITSATVASKGLSDSFWTNKTYARVGGITVEELALLELEFLWRVEWKIVPQPEVLVDYYLSLVERCEGYALEPEGLLSPPSEDMVPESIIPPVVPNETT